MNQQRRSTELWLLGSALLVLLFWPHVNLELTDMTGQASLPLFGPTKLVRILRLLLLVGLTAMTLYRLRPAARWRERLRLSAILLTLSALSGMLAVLVGPINGANIFFAIEFAAFVVAVCVVYFVLREWRSHEQISGVVHRYVLVGFGILLLLLLGGYLVQPELVFRPQPRGYRLGGSMIAPNTLALIGVVVTVSAWAVWVTSRGWLWRSLAAFMVIAGPTSLVMTRTRSCIVLILITALLLDVTRRVDRGRFRWIPIGFASVLAVLMFSIPVLDSNHLVLSLVQEVPVSDAALVTSTTSPASSPEVKHYGTGTLQDRVTLYEYCWGHLSQYWLFGAGYIEGTEDLLAGLFTDTSGRPWQPTHPHNVFFEVLTTRGVLLGGAIALALVLAFWHGAWRGLLPRKNEPGLNLLGVEVVALSLSSLGSFSLAGEIRPIVSALWLFAILLLLDTARDAHRLQADSMPQAAPTNEKADQKKFAPALSSSLQS